MDKTPFSIYDFLAYLSSGAVVVVTVDFLCGSHLFFKESVSPILTVALVLSCYVAGHIVSQFSSILFEQWLVAKLIGRPMSLLMGEQPKWRFCKILFPGFCKPLPLSVVAKVREQAKSRGCAASDEGLFFHCYAITTAVNDKVQGRLDDFRNQYGFARNMSMAFLAACISLSIASAIKVEPVQKRWIFVALVSSLGMLYRYLKFFRQYSYELLIRYAELVIPIRTT